MRFVHAMAPVLASVTLISGCANEPAKVAEAPPPQLTRDDCTTVVLFDKIKIAKPDEAVRPEHQAFLGHWKQGAWEGKWCHDMLVSAVYPDGSVDLFDMHAPYAPWGKPATAFKRKGRINEQGVLTFRHGTEVRRYQIVDGRLHAVRSGATSELHAVLINPETDTRVAAATSVSIPVAKAAPVPDQVKLSAASRKASEPALSLDGVPALSPTEGFGANAAPSSADVPPQKGVSG